mgnify:CR=1 FL=1
MKLINKTKLKTSSIRVMLYDYAHKAHISTRGVIVELRTARQCIHGLCIPDHRAIFLWLFPETKSQDMAFIWVHELQHLAPKNRRLYALGYACKGQINANKKAEQVVGIKLSNITWRSKKCEY